jgi:predicted HTH transcriptional regulator
MAALIQRDETAALGRLRQMVEQGLLDEGAVRGLPTFRLRFGLLLEHIGTPVSLDDLVLDHLRTGGAVSRAQVAELTGLSPDQAKRLLARLVEEGSLEHRGQGRGTSYVARSG